MCYTIRMDTFVFIKRFLSAGFTLYSMMILVRILSSWFPNLQGHPIMQFLARCTDPYLKIFKRIIPPLGMIDLSPMVAMFSLYGIEWLVFSLIP